VKTTKLDPAVLSANSPEIITPWKPYSAREWARIQRLEKRVAKKLANCQHCVDYFETDLANALALGRTVQAASARECLARAYTFLRDAEQDSRDVKHYGRRMRP
jgi:hypothetical protein